MSQSHAWRAGLRRVEEMPALTVPHLAHAVNVLLARLDPEAPSLLTLREIQYTVAFFADRLDDRGARDQDDLEELMDA